MQHSLSKSADQIPVKVLQISDMHILPASGDRLLGIDTGFYFSSVLKQALHEHPQPDLLLLTGDLAQTPTAASYRRIYDVLKNLDIPAICLPGNHDDYELMQKIFRGDHIGCNKQTLFNNWHIICLNSKKADSPGGHLEIEELARLESYLQTYPYYHTLIAVHHHCCDIGSHWLDVQQIDNSKAFLALLGRYSQVRALTSGHIHQVIDLHIGNLQIYSAPSTCFQFRPGNGDFAIDKTAPGYRWFELFADGTIHSGVSRLPGELNELRTDSQGY
ncbi:MAG: metallophosphoesterase [Gammaproteobacteria bacterium]